MAGPRLTALEFHWFGKGHMLATRYEDDEAVDLDASTTALAAAVTNDAKDCFTGAESLRRVADRFGLDADGIGAVERSRQSPSSVDRVGADRRIKALRRLAAHFESAAIDVEVWKRRRAGALTHDARVTLLRPELPGKGRFS